MLMSYSSPDKKTGGKLSNLLKVTQQGRAGRDCPSDWQAFSAYFAWEVSLGNFGAGRQVLHRQVDTAPECSVSPWQRKPTGNAEEPDEADCPGTRQALPDVWPSASAQAASLLCICRPKLYQDVPLFSGAPSSKSTKSRGQASKNSMGLRGQETSSYNILLEAYWLCYLKLSLFLFQRLNLGRPLGLRRLPRSFSRLQLLKKHVI